MSSTSREQLDGARTPRSLRELAIATLSILVVGTLLLSSSWGADEKAPPKENKAASDKAASDKAAADKAAAAKAAADKAAAEKAAAEKAAAEKAAADPGLRGILPVDVPLDLTGESLEVVGGTWAKWSAGVAELVAQLYEGENIDAATQRKIIDTLKGKLGTIDKALADERFAMMFDNLTSLRSRLARRINLADAALATLKQDPAQVNSAQVEQAGKGVAAAIAGLREELSGIPTGAAWLTYVRADQLGSLTQKASEKEKALPIAQAVKERLARRGTLKDEAQKNFLNKPGFAALEKALDGYLAAANAPVKKVDDAALRKALTDLAAGVEAYETNGLAAEGARIPGLLEAVAKVAADDGRRLSSVIRSHYLNSNLQLLASERFLSRLVHEERNEAGAVSDQVSGANIVGSQSTQTAVSVDTKPSTNSGLFNFVLSGSTNSNTAAYSSQAVIYSSGNHQFWASKPVRFNGYDLTTSPATIVVNPSVNNYNASVYGYERGLFSGTATRRALGVANSRLGESIEHARSRVTDSVLPKFNTEADKAMKDANDSLHKLQKRLKDAGVFPEATRVATNDSAMRMQSNVQNKGELAGDVSPSAYNTSGDALLEIHESLANNALRRMNFAGRTMTDEDVRKELERFLTIIAGKEVKLENKPEPGKKPADAAEQPDATVPRAFIFAKEDPIRVKFEGGEIRLILRAGFEQPGKENIPVQDVTVPLIYTVDKGKIHVQTGQPAVKPVEKPDSVAKQLAFAGAITTKIKKSIPNRDRERKVTFERTGKPPVEMNITDIRSQGGWLVLRLE